MFVSCDSALCVQVSVVKLLRTMTLLLYCAVCDPENSFSHCFFLKKTQKPSFIMKNK
jgi:hypothetical protein